MWTYKTLQESGLLLALGAGEEADDRDHAVEGDGFERLGLGGEFVLAETTPRELDAKDK